MSLSESACTGDDVAFVRGAYATSLNGANTGTGNYIEIWQKQSDGEWQIIRNVWNTNGEVPLEGVWKVADIVVTASVNVSWHRQHHSATLD